jgi:allantoicase
LAPRGSPLEDLLRAHWIELLREAPLRPGAQNLFCALAHGPVSHLRLNIFPDGGVARFRAYGQVDSDWGGDDIDETARTFLPAGAVDLGALKNGGVALACSDAFFGPMNNLLLPGRAENMGGGWETRRRRGPGHDWILVQLGARGTIQVAEVDTNHFKGNYPDRCSIDVIDAPSARITELIASAAWSPLLPEKKLSAHERHFFGDLVGARGPATHVRLHIFPDGGVSRLRLWGHRDG